VTTDDTTIDQEREALIARGLLYNPNACEAATFKGFHRDISPLVGRYEDVMHGLAESLSSSRESYDLLYEQHRIANERIRRLENAMRWFLDEYDTDLLTREVFVFAIYNGQGLS